MATDGLEVAIVGGGLCGLALAIALTKRSVPYKIYEARSSFTEIGAGINIGPNSLKAFEAIDQELGHAVQGICSRNAAPHADVWMQLRSGVKTSTFEDHELIVELMAPPTGNMTVSRNDLLRLLASRLPEGRAFFDKKLVSLDSSDAIVTMRFEDGSQATADIVIACDGIHSSVRRAILGAEDPASTPHFIGDGAYRAMIPLTDMNKLLGDPTSRILLGPNGLVVMYPVASGTNMNVGFWIRKKNWKGKEWVTPHVRTEMLADFSAWGETVQKMMDLVPDPSFWATHCHAIQPAHTYKGRVCLIGDSAHSMPPHQGAGAGQAMEDAFVLAETVAQMISVDDQPGSSTIEAAFAAYEAVRQPRYQAVLESSVEAMQFWSDFSTPFEQDVDAFKTAAKNRFASIWEHDVAGDRRQVRKEVRERTKPLDSPSV